MFTEIIRLACVEQALPFLYAHSYYANQGLLLANDGEADLLLVYETPMLGKDTYHNRPALIEGGSFVEMKELTVNGGKPVTAYVFEIESEEISLYMTDRYSNRLTDAKVVRINVFDQQATLSPIDPKGQRGLYQTALDETAQFLEEVYA